MWCIHIQHSVKTLMVYDSCTLCNIGSLKTDRDLTGCS